MYESVNNITATFPRVFLSHMPPSHFEYIPTTKTKIIYQIREPHAVWYSMLKFAQRLRKLVNDKINQLDLDVKIQINETIDPSMFTWDFTKGFFSSALKMRLNSMIVTFFLTFLQ